MKTESEEVRDGEAPSVRAGLALAPGARALPYATACALLRLITRSTISPTIFPVAAISSAVVCLPNDRRTADRARSIGKPIASKTCDAETLPTMQAEPLDAQTPFRSSAMSNISESRPSRLTLRVLARRG